jgi:prepilin-type N-terminal cleavage/methylation domain-containing protein
MPRSRCSTVPPTGGFTLVELMLALVVLTVGVLALVGSSAMAGRMIGRGGRATAVAQLANGRADQLRQVAAGTSPRCAGLTDGSATSAGGVAEDWAVLGVPGDSTRDVRLRLAYRVPAGPRTDTVMLTLDCR